MFQYGLFDAYFFNYCEPAAVSLRGKIFVLLAPAQSPRGSGFGHQLLWAKKQ